VKIEMIKKGVFKVILKSTEEGDGFVEGIHFADDPALRTYWEDNTTIIVLDTDECSLEDLNKYSQ